MPSYSIPVLIILLIAFILAFTWVIYYGTKYMKSGETFFGSFVKKEMFAGASTQIEYYTMAGCPHCEKFNPEWERLVGLAKAEGIQTVKYDAREDRDKVREAGVDGFPTIRLIRNGKSKTYEGPRKADAILAEAKK